MSGRRGRPAGDRHEEPAAYEQAAYEPEPGGPAFAVDPGRPYDEPVPQAYGGGYPDPAQYPQQPGDYAGHEYRQEAYQQQPYAEQPYAEQPFAGQQPYSEQTYGEQPYAEQSYAEPYPDPQYAEQPYAEQQPYVDSYGRPYAEQPYAESYVEQVANPPAGGYGYPDAGDVLPAVAEPGYDTYGYGGEGNGGHGASGGAGEGATSVMPAVIVAGPESDHAVGYEPESAYEPAADYAFGGDGPVEAGSEHGAELEPLAAETAYVPAPRAPEPEPAGPRAAARTPIWDPPGMLPALCTLGLAAALAGTAIVGKPALAVGVALLQVLTAVGWFRLNGMWPARQGIALVVLAAFATDAAVLAKGAEGLASVPAVLAVTLLVVIALQARGGARPGDLLPALTVTASAALVTAFDVAYVVAVDLEGGPMKAGAAVAPAAVAVGVAILVRGVPLPTPVAPILGWLLGTAAGAGA
ncbi:hypothetical protein, partial [Streptomyces sp. SID3343]|uniref:hypothetical protein n=1 Tax=Streptomyces sp. SID3343 TaxID=2690260 RepID=UPI00136D6260